VQAQIVNKAKAAVDKVRRHSVDKGTNKDKTTTTKDKHKSPDAAVVEGGPLRRKTSSDSIHTSDADQWARVKALVKRSKEEAPIPPATGPVARINPAAEFEKLRPRSAPADGRPSTLAQSESDFRINIVGERLAIDTQIQLYATNAQLCHPWVSPVLAYLGGLPPLYIMCGDKEVLRDEIMYAWVP
jgi:acetyl esterase/lipase